MNSVDYKPTRKALELVFEERARNLGRWGLQAHPDGTGGYYGADHAREACDLAAAKGEVTFRHILEEEILEAFEERDQEKLKAELIQVAAVCVAWIEAIDRRGQP